jgi:cytochrome P450 family 6
MSLRFVFSFEPNTVKKKKMIVKDIFIYFVLPVAAFVYFYLRKKFSYFKDRGIPHIKPTWPMGNLKEVGSKVHLLDFIKNTYDECKGKDVVAGVYSFTSPVYLITDPELAKTITIKDFNSFMNRGVHYDEENEPLTGNLFAIEGEKWKFMRNKLSPVFTSGKIKSMFNIIKASGKNLIENIEKRSQSGSIETKDVANRFTVDVISACAFGMDANTLKGENETVVEMMKRIFTPSRIDAIKFLIFFSFSGLAKFLKLRLLSENISDFFMNIVAENIKYREKNNDTRTDFLNMMIQLKNKGSIEGEFSSEVKKLTLNEVLAQSFLFLFAGSDTSSTTISFALIELAYNQDVQKKLRTEITEKTKNSNGEITYENLQEMTYLTQVMNG